MKLSLRLLLPTLAIVLAAGAAALFVSPPAQAQTPETCGPNDVCIESVEITSDGPYMAGSEVLVTVKFTEPVIDDDPNDNATSSTSILIALHHPDTPYAADTVATTTHTVLVTSPESPTDTIVFVYTVSSSDPHGYSVNVMQNSLDTNNLDPEDTNFTFINQNHDHVTGDSTQVIDLVAPTITEVAVSPGGVQGTGGNITARVSFDEPVKVLSGTPMLDFMVGGVMKMASFSSNSGTDVVFTYSIQKGDNGDVSFPESATSSPTIRNGTISDLAGNPAVLEFTTQQISIGDAHSVSTDVTDPVVTYKAPSELIAGIRIRTIKPRTDDQDIASYKLKDGSRLPRNLSLDENTGYISGRPIRPSAPTRLMIEVCDFETPANCVDVPLTLPAVTEAEDDVVASDAEAALPSVGDADLSGIPVGDAAPSSTLLLAMTAAGGALLLSGLGMVAVRRRIRR